MFRNEFDLKNISIKMSNTIVEQQGSDGNARNTRIIIFAVVYDLYWKKLSYGV